MNKQVEEMRSDLIEIFDEEYEKRRLITPQNTAEKLTAKGYRKQSEGEWMQGVHNSKVCSMCGKEPLYTASGTAFATTFYRVKSNYCPNCGARMKGVE